MAELRKSKKIKYSGGKQEEKKKKRIHLDS